MGGPTTRAPAWTRVAWTASASSTSITNTKSPIPTRSCAGTVTGGATLDCGGHGCSVKQIALGTIAACALLEDATVACYGGGIVGTLGRGSGERPDIDPVPRRVPSLKNVARVFGGGYSMCALHDDRTVSCWGPDQSENPYGARPGELFAVGWTVTQSGEVEHPVEHIPCTVAAVRDWLGY